MTPVCGAEATANTCAWCGNPRCEGETRNEPHHSLCCLDRQPAPCWGDAS